MPPMMSKTRLLACVTEHAWKAVRQGLDENPALLGVRAERGRDWQLPCSRLRADVHKNDLDAIRLVIRHGADVNYRNPKQSTPLHYVLAKGSDKAHVRMLVDHGARGDIPNKAGVTAAEILSRKRDPDYRAMAQRLTPER